MNSRNRKISSQLVHNHEIIGTLHAVKEKDICCKLHFTCSKDIVLPLTAIPKKKLASLVGKKVGILNVNGEFFVRIIKSR